MLGDPGRGGRAAGDSEGGVSPALGVGGIRSGVRSSCSLEVVRPQRNDCIALGLARILVPSGIAQKQHS